MPQTTELNKSRVRQLAMQGKSRVSQSVRSEVTPFSAPHTQTHTGRQ